MLLKEHILFMLHLLGNVHGEKKPLYIGVLLELTDHFYVKYTNFFPTLFEYAFQGVYNRSDILTDYEFKLVIRDTKGQPGLAARQLIEMLEEDPPKIAIVGPTMSDSLTVTGQIAPFYNIIELSYIAITATTTDRDLFSTLFKVNQVTDALNPLRIKMMKHFGWTRVGTIAFQEDFSVSQIDHFHGLLSENNMTLVTSAVISDTDNIPNILKRYKQFGIRIIVGAFRSQFAPQIFCEAHQLNMYGNSHVWILTGPTMFDGWIDEANFDEIRCTKEELIEAARGYFTLEHLRESESSELSVSMKAPEEVMADLNRLAGKTKYSLSSFASWIYDTPWALAIGLNNSLKYLERSGLQLHNYNYSSAYLEAIVQGMREVQFQGVSGPVAFDERGSRIGINFIKQNFYGKKTIVASFDGDNLTWLVDSSSLWPGSEIPQDRFTYQDVLVAPSISSFVLIVTLDCGGCVLSFTVLFFNICYRKNRSIKMSSPMVNNVIITGCMLMYIEIIIDAIDYSHLYHEDTGGTLCMVRIWLLSLGFTSSFGALFSKTYRVYVVFRDYKFKMKPIKDYHLFGMIGIMLVIDVVILIPWTILYPFEKAKLSRKTMDVLSSNMIYSESYLHCYNENSSYWFAAMYVYKGLLLAFGTFLAWETRQVKVPGLNDSKHIGVCIYNVVIACLFGVPLAHALPTEQTTLTFMLESCLLFFCTTSTQCIIFIPKIKMRHQVHGRFLTMPDQAEPTVSTSRANAAYPVLPDIELEDAGQYEDLKEQNVQLRMEVANEAIAIARLRKSLLESTGNVHFYRSGASYVVFKRTGLGPARKICIPESDSVDHSM